MGAPKRYFREQFRVNKITLDHDSLSDFYVTCWQAGRSPVPLLCIRLIIFLGCVGILTASLTVTRETIDLVFWPIYMTHWGVAMIAVTSGLAFLVSLMATLKGSIDSESLPWYVRLYWATYCITVPTAFFISIFYYALLANLDEDFAVDPVLDLFIHGINSVMMVCLLVTADHPVHLLQFLYPFVFTVIYMIFSIIYYYAGGTNPQGNTYIYPMLDWAKPGTTTILVVACAVFLLVMHIVVVCLSALRDYVSRKYVTKMNTIDFDY